MRKGLKNLVAVAVALLGVNAMAMAPVISDLPSPIIGDLDGSTGSNHFVFEDAFNLNTFVSDDFTTDGGIRWSYEVSGTQLYSVNNAAALGGASNPISPSAGESLEGNTDPDDIDADPYTVTLRDISLSPVGGPDVDPGAAGIVNSQVVTFWASDGTTATSQDTIFYTDNEGEDRFSGGFAPLVSYDFTTGANGWTYRESLGGAMTGAQNAGGLCVTSVLSDVAIEGWVTDPANAFDLVDNSVYQMRMNLTSTATGTNATPILQYVVNNTAGTAADGFAYGGEFFIVDQEGGANAVANRAGGEYRWYFAPTQVQVSNWRDQSTGAFAAANAGIKNFRLEMNVFDVDGVAAAENRSGTICMTALVIERADLAALGTGSAVFGIASGGFTTANHGIANGLLAINGAVSGGNLVATASAGDTGLLNFEPGPSPFAADAAHFPIAVVADSLYKIEWTAAASAGTSPIEIIRVNADLPTNEIIQNAYAAASGAGLGTAALPTMGGAAETYTAFFYTHSATLSGALPQNWRSTLTLAQRPDVNGATAPNSNLTFSAVSVVPVN